MPCTYPSKTEAAALPSREAVRPEGRRGWTGMGCRVQYSRAAPAPLWRSVFYSAINRPRCAVWRCIWFNVIGWIPCEAAGGAPPRERCTNLARAAVALQCIVVRECFPARSHTGFSSALSNLRGLLRFRSYNGPY